MKSYYLIEDDYRNNKKVFVYGTLKRGHGNNSLLSNATLLGSARTEYKYFMEGTGFPFVYDNDDYGERHPVRGEVYELDSPITLIYLDHLESEGSLYRRKEVPIEGYGNVWMYVAYLGSSYPNPVELNDEGEFEW